MLLPTPPNYHFQNRFFVYYRGVSSSSQLIVSSAYSPGNGMSRPARDVPSRRDSSPRKIRVGQICELVLGKFSFLTIYFTEISASTLRWSPLGGASTPHTSSGHQLRRSNAGTATSCTPIPQDPPPAACVDSPSASTASWWKPGT